MKITESIRNFLHRKRSGIKSDKLLNNIFWNVVARFGSAGLSFLTTLFLMSILNVADYGQFVVMFSIYSTIPFFFDFGLNNMFVSSGAKAKQDDEQAFHGLVGNFTSIKILTLLAVFLITAFGAILNAWSIDIFFVVVLGGVLGVWEFILTIFKSSQNFKLLSKLLPLRSALVILVILLLYTLGIRKWMTYLYVVMLVPLVMAGAVYLRYFTKVSIRFDFGILKKALTEARWITLFTLITALHARADIYLLDYFTGLGRIDAREVGIFSAAFSLLAVINLATATFAEAILPKVSEEANLGYFQDFIRRIKRTIPLVIALAVLAGGVIFAAFTWGFGGKYVDSVQCLLFLGLGMILLFYLHTLYTLFYPTNRTDLVFMTILIMFAVNISVGYFLIPRLGALGASITNLLVCATGLGFVIIMLQRVLAYERARLQQ